MSADVASVYEGLAVTLSKMVQGLILMKALDPADDPSAQDAKEDLLQVVEEMTGPEEASYAMLMLLRLSKAMGVRPTTTKVPEAHFVVADIESGLELIGHLRANKEEHEAFMGAALALSCVVDYCRVLTDDLTKGLDPHESDEVLRSAIYVAESSARMVSHTERMTEAARIFHQMALLLEEDSEEEGEAGEDEEA